MRNLITLVLFFISISFPAQKNKILSGGKTLTYATHYTDSINGIYISDTIKFVQTNIPWRFQPGLQTTVLWKFSNLFLPDSVIKKIYSIGWYHIDSTGAIDSDHQFMIHPPRNNHYTITQIAPFPLIKYKTRIGKKYKMNLSIGRGWGPWEGLKLISRYKITATVVKTVNGTSYDCWVTESRNESKLGTSTLTTKFNNKIGFTEFDYHFYNKVSLSIDLIKVE